MEKIISSSRDEASSEVVELLERIRRDQKGDQKTEQPQKAHPKSVKIGNPGAGKATSKSQPLSQQAASARSPTLPKFHPFYAMAGAGRPGYMPYPPYGPWMPYPGLPPGSCPYPYPYPYPYPPPMMPQPPLHPSAARPMLRNSAAPQNAVAARPKRPQQRDPPCDKSPPGAVEDATSPQQNQTGDEELRPSPFSFSEPQSLVLQSMGGTFPALIEEGLNEPAEGGSHAWDGAQGHVQAPPSAPVPVQQPQDPVGVGRPHSNATAAGGFDRPSLPPGLGTRMPLPVLQLLKFLKRAISTSESDVLPSPPKLRSVQQQLQPQYEPSSAPSHHPQQSDREGPISQQMLDQQPSDGSCVHPFLSEHPGPSHHPGSGIVDAMRSGKSPFTSQPQHQQRRQDYPWQPGGTSAHVFVPRDDDRHPCQQHTPCSADSGHVPSKMHDRTMLQHVWAPERSEQSMDASTAVGGLEPRKHKHGKSSKRSRSIKGDKPKNPSTYSFSGHSTGYYLPQQLDLPQNHGHQHHSPDQIRIQDPQQLLRSRGQAAAPHEFSQIPSHLIPSMRRSGRPVAAEESAGRTSDSGEHHHFPLEGNGVHAGKIQKSFPVHC